MDTAPALRVSWGWPSQRVGLSVGVAYQATDPTKPAVFLVTLSAQATISLLSTTEASQIGSLNVASSAAAAIDGSAPTKFSYRNIQSGTLVATLVLNQELSDNFGFVLPIGGYWAVTQSAGTRLEIVSCYEQPILH